MSCEVVDPRQARGRRHGHPGLLGLLVAAFACGLKNLRRVEDLAQDLGGRVRRQLGLAASVSDSTSWWLLAAQTPTRLRQTMAAQVRRLLKAPGPPTGALPLGVMSFDGKSLWTSVPREVDGLEACAVFIGQDVVLRRLGHARSGFASHAHAAHFGTVAQRVAYTFRQVSTRLRHHHLPAVNADSGVHGGEGDDARLHEAPNHLHPLGGDDELRARHHSARAHLAAPTRAPARSYLG